MPNQSHRANTLLHVNDRDAEHAPSYYAATAVGVPELPSLAGEHSCDVAVIGGGYSGLSCALHRPGAATTSRSSRRTGSVGGLGAQRRPCRQRSAHRPDELEKLVGETLARRAWDIAEQAKTLVKDLVRRHEIPCDLRSGYLHANHRRRFDRHARAYAGFLNERYDYRDVRYVPPEEMASMLGARGYFGGFRDGGAAHLHPLNYALGIARAALAAGARLFERSEVLEVTPGDPVRVRTASGTVKAKYVVYACNGYLGALEPRVGDRVMPINNFVIATEPLGEDRARSLIAGNECVSDSRFVINYFRLSADRRMLFGGGENYGYRFPADIKSFVRRPMLEVFPQLADARIDYGWGGTLGITMSRLPHFERLDGNRLSISGYSGHGVALATLAGAVAAEAIDGVATRFDIMNALPTPRFPGGSRFRSALLVLAMTWFALRDRL
ncbi:MAG: FAD-binding oxidoreductase [Gammaproteobacteria bacterium]|nr:FAD-binding oxidoreductase [Gammaproteobacteria bacterium]